MTELRPWVWCLPFLGTQCSFSYSLGPQRHDKTLINKTLELNDRDFIIGNIYTDLYWSLCVLEFSIYLLSCLLLGLYIVKFVFDFLSLVTGCDCQLFIKENDNDDDENDDDDLHSVEVVVCVWRWGVVGRRARRIALITCYVSIHSASRWPSTVDVVIYLLTFISFAFASESAWRWTSRAFNKFGEMYKTCARLWFWTVCAIMSKGGAVAQRIERWTSN